MPETVEITELLEIDPSRVDAVGSPANGTEWLMLKALPDELKPEIGETLDAFKARLDAAKASAPSGAPVAPADECPTCHGNGKIIQSGQGATEDTDDCPDCGGSGKDAHFPETDALNTMNGDAGSITVGDSRETVDKSEKYAQADRDKMADAGQAMPDGAYPIKDAEDLGKAIHAVGRGGADHDSIRKHIMDRAKALNLESQIPDNWNADGSMGKSEKEDSPKVDGPVEKDGIVSGPNPFLGGSVSTDTTTAASPATASDDDVNTPGSAAWESVDADCATQAATFLMQAADLISAFAEREGIEVAAGEGNDLFDQWDAQCALDAVTAALGVMARLAFHEGMEASKAAKCSTCNGTGKIMDGHRDCPDCSDNEGVAEKAGKRLSTKSVTALAAARDHLTELMGDDDPAKSDDDATKSEKDILDMNADELKALVKETVVEAVAETVVVTDESDVAKAKGVNPFAGKGKKKAKAAADTTDDGDTSDDAAKAEADAAEKATDDSAEIAPVELTKEEIEAKEARKAAKKELKKAEKAEKQAAKNAATAKAIEEAVAKATEAVDSLKDQIAEAEKATADRLAVVEKMAAPGGPVKTRPQDAINKAAERDTRELRIATLEREMRETSDPAVRAGNREIIKELRDAATAG